MKFINFDTKFISLRHNNGWLSSTSREEPPSKSDLYLARIWNKLSGFMQSIIFVKKTVKMAKLPFQTDSDSSGNFFFALMSNWNTKEFLRQIRTEQVKKIIKKNIMILFVFVFYFLFPDYLLQNSYLELFILLCDVAKVEV